MKSKAGCSHEIQDDTDKFAFASDRQCELHPSARETWAVDRVAIDHVERGADREKVFHFTGGGAGYGLTPKGLEYYNQICPKVES